MLCFEIVSNSLITLLESHIIYVLVGFRFSCFSFCFIKRKSHQWHIFTAEEPVLSEDYYYMYSTGWMGDQITVTALYTLLNSPRPLHLCPVQVGGRWEGRLSPLISQWWVYCLAIGPDERQGPVCYWPCILKMLYFLKK